MATQPEQVAEGEPEIKEAETPPAGQEPPIDTDDEPPEPPPPDPVEDLAKGMGWRPKTDFKGDPNLWKPAADYIKAGAEIQKTVSRELKDLRGTMDNMTRTQAAIVQQTIETEREKLVARYNKAVEDGDAQSTYRIGQDINNLNGQAQQLMQPPPPQAQPEAEAWVERNPWYTRDPLARNLALVVAEQYSQAGHGADAQLAAAEREVRKAYPHLFPAPEAKEPPGVATPGARSGSAGKKGSTYADMPVEAQKVAKDMAERGVIPDREAYAKQYWQNQKKGA